MADEPKMAPIVEQIPSVEMSISALASAKAPIIYFDSAPFCAQAEGVGSVSPTTIWQVLEMPEQYRAGCDRVITAHLRGSIAAFKRLRDLIDGMILLAEPKPPGEMN